MISPSIFFWIKILQIVYPAASISTRIAFGACHFPGISAPIYKQIAQRNPDLFIWNGDITYIDHATWDPRSGLDSLLVGLSLVEAKPAALSKWPSLYNITKNEAHYQLLLDTNVSIVGTYDDHDYGKDDAFGEFKYKDYSQNVFLDFLDVEEDDPLREQEGIYQHLAFEVHMNPNVTKIIDIILLDLHYFAQLESKEDILGSTEWSWLYNVVQNETHGDLLLIVSSLQILPVGRTGENSWGTTFAQSQRELFNLLISYNTNKRVLLLSGDLHRAETLEAQCIHQETGERQSFYEISSSGLTHGTGDLESYLLRQSVVIDDYLMYDGTVMCRYKPRNFGEINVEWILNSDGNDFEIESVRSVLMDINGDEKCVNHLPLWNNNAPLKYYVDDSKFVMQQFGDYKCYGAKQQHSIHESKSASGKYIWIWLIIFAQFGAFVLFYLTSFVVAVIKCAKPSNKWVKWMNVA